VADDVDPLVHALPTAVLVMSAYDVSLHTKMFVLSTLAALGWSLIPLGMRGPWHLTKNHLRRSRARFRKSTGLEQVALLGLDSTLFVLFGSWDLVTRPWQPGWRRKFAAAAVREALRPITGNPAPFGPPK